jgi:radical SAM protein with 4Fe4S-binding SPASM domain
VTNATLLPRWEEVLLGHPALRRIHLSLQSLETLETGAEEALRVAQAFAARAEQVGLALEWRSWKGRSGRQGWLVGPRTALLTDAEFRWPALADPVLSLSGFCLGLRDQVAVLVDGTVVPCCLDGEGVMALGNLYREDLGDILAGPRAQAFHRGFSEGRCVEPLCQRCQFRQRFNRQGGAARVETC